MKKTSSNRSASSRKKLAGSRDALISLYSDRERIRGFTWSTNNTRTRPHSMRTAKRRTSSNTGKTGFIVLCRSVGQSCSILFDARWIDMAAGRLRGGINFGKALLASQDAGGIPRGIAFDLAQELALRANASLEVVSYTTAGKMADGAKSGEWDLAFLATDPDRTAEIIFTSPYLEIDTTGLVPSDSPLVTVADVDRTAVRVAVSDKSAYDLFLSRHLKHAELVRVPGVEASVRLFFTEKLDVLAGLKPLLIEVTEKHPGTRVLEGRFTAVQQAIGVPKARAGDVERLAEFVSDIKNSGLVAEL